MKDHKRRKSDKTWDPHLYLLGTANDLCHNPSPDMMGSKAYNLLRMARIGLSVPPALVIGTFYTRAPKTSLEPLVRYGLPALEKATGMKLGDSRTPLIVSVRSGAPVSMPGMMATLLNVGLCEATLPGLLRQTGNPRMVWDAYRRLIATHANVVTGMSDTLFEEELERVTRGRDERTLDFISLRDLAQRYQAIYRQQAGQPFPQDPMDQLSTAVMAVFASWNTAKARKYRELHGIDESMGTAVTIQRMVFGNSGSHAGAGVGFTRNPITGDKHLWIDFLTNAQGEDVVSGQRNAHGHESLAETAPAAWTALQHAASAIEGEFQDMQDFEFTVQDGSLYMLQSRNGKRTAIASARIALDMLEEGLIDARTAQQRTEHLSLEELSTLEVVVKSEEGKAGMGVKPIASAIPACNGVVVGEIVLNAEEARKKNAAGKPIILVRNDAQTSDIEALDISLGLLTHRGARTSHAAVVARQLGKVCLVGCETLRIDRVRQTVSFSDHELASGSVITLDGNSGLVYDGAIKTVKAPDLELQRRLKALRRKPASVHKT
jgi:pyruvate,orthophosphate dikinase